MRLAGDWPQQMDFWVQRDAMIATADAAAAAGGKESLHMWHRNWTAVRAVFTHKSFVVLSDTG